MFNLRIRLVCLTAVFSLAANCSQTLAVTYNLSPSDNWFSTINGSSSLGPGDTVILEEGVYTVPTRLSMGHVGTASQPITIRAADGADVTIRYPNITQNVINIEGAQYLTLKGLEVTGGSAGIRIKDGNGLQSKFITLDGNKIHDVGDVAVTANFIGNSYEGMHFLNNEIYNTSNTGEGFYLGCNNNACQFFDGIIERNYVHHTNGPSVTFGNGIQIKDGSYNNIVRDNVIHDTRLTGILIYGVEEQGARNIIERNVIWNTSQHAIQAAADAVIRNNIIFSAGGDGIHSQNHQGAIPGNLTIENNTVRSNGGAIKFTSPTGGSYSGPIEINNNALYPAFSNAIELSTLANMTLSNNVGTGFASGGLNSSQFDNSGNNLLTDFVNFAGMNAFPAVGSSLIGAGNASLQSADDFNTTSRTGSNDVGAYVFDANGNPGWMVGTGFKQFPVSGIPGDFDGDGDVDGHDFLEWQRNPTLGDLADWQNNYAPLVAAVGSVPEPSSLLLISVGSLLTLGRRNSRS